MDIQMRFTDGMTAAEKIRTLDHEVIIMFITNDSVCSAGIWGDAMDYGKASRIFRLSQKLDKAIGRMKKQCRHIYRSPRRTVCRSWQFRIFTILKARGIMHVASDGQRWVSVQDHIKRIEDSMSGYGFFVVEKDIWLIWSMWMEYPAMTVSFGEWFPSAGIRRKSLWKC